MDYWAKRGLLAEETETYLNKLVDQLLDNAGKSDSIAIDLQRDYVKVSQGFDKLRIKYDELDEDFKDVVKTNSQLNDKVNQYEGENGTLVRSRNTAWIVAGVEAVIIGLVVGILVSK